MPNWCAVSQTSLSSSNVQVEISPVSLPGPDGQTTDMDLDPVDTHFYLFVNFSDDLIGRMDDSGVAAGALIGQEPGRRTTHTVDQHVAARGHARPFNDTPLNCVAQVYPYIEHAVRVEETGETRS